MIWLVLGLGFDTMASGGPRPEWLTASRTAPLLAVTSKAMVDFVEKRRHPADPAAADSAADPVAPADPVLPPGHPPIHRGTHGYSRDDRTALDKLLDSGGKTPL